MNFVLKPEILSELITNRMVKVRIEQVMDADELLSFVGDVYDIAKEIWMIEHLGLCRERAINNSKIEIDYYNIGYKINKFELPSDHFCQEKNRQKPTQCYLVNVTWIADLNSV